MEQTGAPLGGVHTEGGGPSRDPRWAEPEDVSAAPPPEVCAQKLRRERDKQLTRRARHNGSRNFAKTRSSHGKIKHKEKLDQEY